MAPHPHHKGGEQSPKQHRVGEHWSGANPVPTISKFMERLERDKQEREAHAAEVTARHDQRQMDRTAGEAGPHQPRKRPKGKTRMVTDPTTGRDIEVEDQDEESMEVVKNPKVLMVLPSMMDDVQLLILTVAGSPECQPRKAYGEFRFSSPAWEYTQRRDHY